MKKIIILFVLITIFSVIYTAMLIVERKIEQHITNAYMSNSSASSVKTDNNLPSKQNVELYKTYHQSIQDNVEGIELNDIFYENPITWNRVDYNISNEVVGTYYQISGLKNKEVENKVNEKLKKSFEQFVEDNKEFIIREVMNAIKEEEYSYENNWTNRKIDKPYVLQQEVLSSFGNVISCANYFNKNYGSLRNYSSNNDTPLNITNEFVNINLNNGSDLKFEELFTKDADFVRLIGNAYHSNIRDVFEYYEYSDNQDWIKIDNTLNFSPENIEIKIEKLIKTFKSSEKTSFGFSPSRLFLSINGQRAEISLKENNYDVAIYSRFLNDDIFENNHNKNGIRVFTDVTYDNSLLYSMINENIECYIYKDFHESVEPEVLNNYISIMNNYISTNNVRNACLVMQISRFDSKTITDKFNNKSTNDLVIYYTSGIALMDDSIQDYSRQYGLFSYNYGNDEVIIGVENDKILSNKEIIDRILPNEEKFSFDELSLKIDVEFDGRERNLYLNNYNNFSYPSTENTIYCSYSRYVQYSRITNFTGVT